MKNHMHHALLRNFSQLTHLIIILFNLNAKLKVFQDHKSPGSAKHRLSCLHKTSKCTTMTITSLL